MYFDENNALQEMYFHLSRYKYKTVVDIYCCEDLLCKYILGKITASFGVQLMIFSVLFEDERAKSFAYVFNTETTFWEKHSKTSFHSPLSSNRA